MTTRVRLIMTWTVKIQPQGPFSTIEDFKNHAKRILVDGFSNYNSELDFTKIDELNSELSDIHMAWDVDLDTVPGAFHEPTDHATAAQVNLVDQIKLFAMDLTVTTTLRHADFREAVDHGEILVDGNTRGLDLTSDDYPTFIPQTEPTWPEADEVWLQDGHWFWTVSTVKFGSIAAGPKPEKIFAPWDPEFRGPAYAQPKTEMDAELAS